MPLAPVVSAQIADVDRARADAPLQTPAPSAAQGASAGAFAATLARAVQRVEPNHTPLGGDEAASALSNAYASVTGRAPTAKQLSLLVAQWSLETGGGRAMMNYNFGGIKGTSPSGMSTAYKTKEGYGATERTITDQFRAYRTPQEGAADYLRVLRAHFPKSFDAVRAGDAQVFAHTLKREGYYTGNEADYTKAIASISERALTGGFAAIGHARDSSGASGASSHTRPAIALSSDEPADPLESMRAMDALRMADEMSRAALRIAATDLGPRGES
jgi:hypothetical protein